MNIEEYVRRLQRDCCDRLGLNPPDQMANQISRLYMSYIRERYRCGEQLPSPYEVLDTHDTTRLAAQLQSIDVSDTPELESAGDYAILRWLTERIEKVLKAQRRLPVKCPLFRTFPHGHVNAVSLRLRGTGEYGVLFHRGLFGLVYALMLDVVNAIPDIRSAGILVWRADPGEVDDRLKDDPTVVWRFTGLLVSYLVAGNARFSQLFIPGKLRLRLAEEYTWAAELFVAGHEYAHIVEDHLGHGVVETGLADGSIVERFQRRWDQEYAADWRGFLLAAEAVSDGPSHTPGVYAAVEVLLHSFEILDRAGALLRFGDHARTRTPTTHPPPLARRTALRASLEREIGTQNCQPFLHSADVLLGVLERLWNTSLPELKMLHEAGVRPMFPLDRILQ